MASFQGEFVSGLDDFEQLLHDYLKKTHSAFAVIKKNRSFGCSEEVADSTKRVVSFEKTSEHGVEIPYDGMPFIRVGEKRLACVHGTPPRKPDKGLKRKKSKCPAIIVVQHVIKFPEFKIFSNTKWNRDKASRELREVLQNSTGIDIGQTRYYYRLPRVSEHKCHATGETINNQESILEESRKMLKEISDATHKIKDQQKISQFHLKLKELHELAKNISSDNEEVLTPLAIASQKQFNYSHITAGATAFGKSLLPRDEALLDVAPLSDVTEIQSEDTFVRTTYAGNAVTTVKSNDAIKVFTVRGTAFAPAEADGSTVASENAPEADTNDLSAWEKDLTVSDRPELTSADQC